jgi:hypothetical protein
MLDVSVFLSLATRFNPQLSTLNPQPASRHSSLHQFSCPRHRKVLELAVAGGLNQ